MKRRGVLSMELPIHLKSSLVLDGQTSGTIPVRGLAAKSLAGFRDVMADDVKAIDGDAHGRRANQ